MIFLIGITKGMITIINNHAIRQVTGSSNKYLNLLHMWYAVGAFLSPFVTMILMGAGMNWKTIRGDDRKAIIDRVDGHTFSLQALFSRTIREDPEISPEFF